MRSRTIAPKLMRRRTHPDAGHIRGAKVVVSRIAAVLLLAAAAPGLVAPAANAVPEQQLDDNLAALWTTVLKKPYAQNPLGGGPTSTCIVIGSRTVAPFPPSKSCAVKPGTKIFIVASPVQCNTFERDGTTEAQLRDCARKKDLQTAPSVTVDGRSLSMTNVETQLLNIELPENNIFGQSAGTTGSFVGRGWVTLLQPLRPGEHTITIDDRVTTRILVRRACPFGTGGSRSCTHVAQGRASQY